MLRSIVIMIVIVILIGPFINRDLAFSDQDQDEVWNDFFRIDSLPRGYAKGPSKRKGLFK